MKAIISGGGTGGHIFPAIAIANALVEAKSADILFVGAKGKMEMTKVPEAGYDIVGLPIRGIQRKLSPSNLLVPFLLIQSLIKSYRTIRKFKPDVVIGVGGYASAAIVYVASWMNIKTMIQEQNSYPGITNKILSKRVDQICVAFEQMDRFFPAEKIKLTGNPIRQNILNTNVDQSAARQHFGLDPTKKTILSIGGSLGARTLNNCMLQLKDEAERLDIQIIWQSGKFYYESLKAELNESNNSVKLLVFIQEMDQAYAAADIVVSRAGALSVSEITTLKKASILIPSPNVSEDHQTKNAQALITAGAAILLNDNEAESQIVGSIEGLLSGDDRLMEIQKNLEQVFSNANAARDIAEVAIQLSQTS